MRAAETVARTLTLAHYDPARDYQTGVQQVRRPGAGTRAERVDLPAALDAAEARTLATRLLTRAETERVRRTVVLDIDGAAVAPGDRVTIAGEAGTWRVTAARLEAMTTTLELSPLTPAPLAIASSPGRVLGAPDRPIGTTLVHVFELPDLDDTLLTAPRLLVAAAGTAPGWRRAALLQSLDEGTSWTSAGATALPATIGTVVTPPADGPATVIDRVATIEVELAHAGMTLASADPGRIDGGANLAMVGGELLQFGEAAQLSPTRWRLARLLRARRGVAAAHLAGERFVLIEAATLLALTVPATAIGRRVRILASGVGDGATPASAETTVTGCSVAPPAPVRLTAAPAPDGSVQVTWLRRSRLGWTWRDGGDAPLGEEREAYRVTIAAGAGIRNEIVTGAAARVTMAEAAAGARLTVRQLGTVAESADATIII